MQEEKEQCRPPSTISRRASSPTSISLNNWSSSVKSVVAPSSNDSQIDPLTLCRLCFETLKNPMMLIPCGHSFCKNCIDSRNVTKCPACLQTIQFQVINQILQQILEKKVSTHSLSSAPAAGMASGIDLNLDYDEDAELLLHKYKEQQDRLDARIELLSLEKSNLEKEEWDKNSKLDDAKKTFIEATGEMKDLAIKIESYRKRLHELDAIAKAKQPLIPQLEHDVGQLKSKGQLVQETLASLRLRREKVHKIYSRLCVDV